MNRIENKHYIVLCYLILGVALISSSYLMAILGIGAFYWLRDVVDDFSSSHYSYVMQNLCLVILISLGLWVLDFVFSLLSFFMPVLTNVMYSISGLFSVILIVFILIMLVRGVISALSEQII